MPDDKLMASPQELLILGAAVKPEWSRLYDKIRRRRAGRKIQV